MKLFRDRNDAVAAIAISAVGLLLFASSINHPFHFDDALITSDTNVTTPSHFLHFFNPLHLRQLTFFSFYLNHLIAGDNPGGYHGVNVLLHVANAVLLFILLSTFFERWLAVASAALFLIHPIQTEPVLYVYQRSILLGCFFSLLALIALTRNRPWLAAVLFFCAFESKEVTLAVPLAVAGLVVVSNRRYRIALAAGGLILASAALGLLAYWNEQTVGVGLAGRISPLTYFMTESRVVYTYIRLLFLPYSQSLEYEFGNQTSWIPLLGICAFLTAAWIAFRNEEWRVPAGCVLAFAILLAPTSSFVPSADFAFEHRLYLPMLAFSVFAAWCLSKLPQRTFAAAALFAVLALLTIHRETVWASDISLWENAVQHAPGKARTWFNLGGAYLNKDPEKARTAFSNALQLKPDFVEAWYDLGTLEQKKGRLDAAIADYQRAAELDPQYWQAWNNTAVSLFTMGNREAALRDFEKTLSLNPDYWPAQYNIGVIHFMAGRYTDALTRLKIVLDWRPDFREARYALAMSYSRIGARDEADREWKRLGGTSETSAEPRLKLSLAN